jgi:hypothetical protein
VRPSIVSSPSRHVCACVMCKGGAKNCCCKSGSGQGLRAADCDLTAPGELLIGSIHARLPAPLLALKPGLTPIVAATTRLASESAPTRSLVPLDAPPRFLS